MIDEHEKRIVQGFTPEEREQFLNLLRRAIKNLHPENGCVHQKEETKA